MKNFAYCFIRSFLFFALVGLVHTIQAQNNIRNTYACMPCGLDCDQHTYNAPGKCSHCNMTLVLKHQVKFTNISPRQLCKRVNTNPKVILLDVRTKEEFEGNRGPAYGRLKNAINIPVQQLNARIKELEPYKNHEIIVYCSHSHRSPRASYLLNTYGFGNVKNMLGGMSQWQKESNTACSKKLWVKTAKK